MNRRVVCYQNGCNNSSNETIMRHLGPNNPVKYAVWVTAIGREDLLSELDKPMPTKKIHICDTHFPEDMKVDAGHGNSRLIKTAYPKLHLPPPKADNENSNSEMKKWIETADAILDRLNNAKLGINSTNNVTETVNDDVIEIVNEDDPLATMEKDPLEIKNDTAFLKVLKPNLISQLKSTLSSLPFSSVRVNRTNVADEEKRVGLIKGYKPLPAQVSSTTPKTFQQAQNYADSEVPKLLVNAPKSVDNEPEVKYRVTYVKNSEGKYVKKFIKMVPREMKSEPNFRRKLMVPLQKIPIKNPQQRIPLQNITVVKKEIPIKQMETLKNPQKSTFVITPKPSIANADASMTSGNDVNVPTINAKTNFVQNFKDAPSKIVDLEICDLDEEACNLVSTLKTYELQLMCRICFTKSNLVDIYEAKHENKKLWQLIFELTNEKLVAYGPRNVCQACMETIIQAYKFQKLFKRASIIVEGVVERNKKEAEKRKISVIQNSKSNGDIIEIASNDHNYVKELVVNSPQSIQKGEEMDEEYLDLLQCRLCDFSGKKLLIEIIRHHADKHAVKLSLDMKCAECLVCKVNIDPFELREHFDSEQHKKKCQLCKLCFEVYPTKKILRTHMLEEHDVVGGKIKELSRNYPCNLCKIIFKTFKEIDDHYDQYHSDTPNCIICGNACKAMLMKHHLLIHLPYGLFLCCRICRISFNSREELKAHNQSQAHSLCNICKTEFSSPKMFVRHMKMHRESFVCEFCGYICSGKNSLDRHMEVHSTKMYYCDKCPSKFSTTGALNSHRRRHELICQVCNASFEAEWKFILHKARHDVPTAVICSVPKCHKTYPSKEELTAHLTESHEAYTCTICDKKFYTMNTFTGHKSIHLWESTPDVDNPNKCKLCMKLFNSENAKRGHIISMHKIYNCTVCPKMFPNCLKLKSHQVQEHNMSIDPQWRVNRKKKINMGVIYPSVNYSCNYCGKKFSSNLKKKVHERTHTGDKQCTGSVSEKQYVQQDMKIHQQQKYLDVNESPKRRRIDVITLEEFFQSQAVASIIDDEEPTVSYY